MRAVFEMVLGLARPREEATPAHAGNLMAVAL
jgi:hypothetical protein